MINPGEAGQEKESHSRGGGRSPQENADGNDAADDTNDDGNDALLMILMMM